MSLFKTLALTGITNIDWDMTPEYTFGTYESWGGVERVRNQTERIYYFFIDAWNEEPKLCLMERGIKHARVLAEILAPPAMLQHCVAQQGKVAFFERSHPINEEIKQWLITNVLETNDDSKVILLHIPEEPSLGASGLPSKEHIGKPIQQIVLPVAPIELSEEALVTLVLQYNFADQERNPKGEFGHIFADNGDDLTITDFATGLMWQREGTDIASYRSMCLTLAKTNAKKFAGYNNWRLPSMAEALSLLDNTRSENDQYLHPCFSRHQPFIFVEATRKPGGHWFVDYKQGRAFWASGTIPGGFGRFCRTI